jgi:hypothetical protein
VARSLRGREAIAAVLSDVWRYEVSASQVDRLMVRDSNPLPAWNPTGGVVVADEDEVRAWARPQGPKQLPLSQTARDARRKQ